MSVPPGKVCRRRMILDDTFPPKNFGLLLFQMFYPFDGLEAEWALCLRPFDALVGDFFEEEVN